MRYRITGIQTTGTGLFETITHYQFDDQYPLKIKKDAVDTIGKSYNTAYVQSWRGQKTEVTVVINEGLGADFLRTTGNSTINDNLINLPRV